MLQVAEANGDAVKCRPDGFCGPSTAERQQSVQAAKGSFQTQRPMEMLKYWNAGSRILNKRPKKA